MPLTSLRFLVVCIVVAVSIPAALVALWRRAPRSSRWAIPAVLVCALFGQGAAVVAVAVDVNRNYGFYPSWASLFGTGAALPVVVNRTRIGLNGQTSPHRLLPGVSEPASDTGSYSQVTLKGVRSGITKAVVAWLPPQYSDHRYDQTRFPVVMVLGGADVRTADVIQRLDFATVASEEIRSGRVAPFVAVFPELNVARPLDTECTDYPGSFQAFTWLNQDVRNWVTSRFRVTNDGRRWSVMGWSTGGYCAALLHLRSPERFGAAASVEGYFNPEPDSTTGNLAQLLTQDQTLAHDSSPTWLIQNRPPRSLHLLVMTSQQDPQSRPQSLQFLGRVRDIPGIQPYVVKGLGHTLDAYSAVLAPILGWLAEVAHA
ncbi:MAG: alpha/beta hydrolase-fold protein [Actinomycetota bacterium]